MARMTKHGVNGYRQHQCRCLECRKAYEGHLKQKREQRRGKSNEKLFPSVTNTLIYDTMTRKQYDRLRNETT